MSEINLLPQGKRAKGSLEKVHKILKNLATISLVVLIISTLLYFSGTAVLAFRINGIETQKTDLRNEIESLQNVETKFVLVKDRLAKISEIEKVDEATEEIEILKTIQSITPQSVKLSGATLGKNFTSITISTPNSSGLTEFYTKLISSGFKKISMRAFKFDQKKGYVVDLEITK